MGLPGCNIDSFDHGSHKQKDPLHPGFKAQDRGDSRSHGL